MDDEDQIEMQTAELKFYPPLGTKTRELRDVHLLTASDKIYRGILIRFREVKKTEFVVLLNQPEIKILLSEATQKRLKKRIKDKLFEADAGLL